MNVNEFIDLMLGRGAEPSPFAVIYDGNLTAMVWEDGTTTKTHRQDPDKYDPLFGTIACIVRKLTNNRGHAIDDNEALITELANGIQSVDDIDGLIQYAKFTLSILNVLHDSVDLWLPHLGPAEEKPESAKPDIADEVADAYCKGMTEISEKEREATRAEIRRIMDMGDF